MVILLCSLLLIISSSKAATLALLAFAISFFFSTHTSSCFECSHGSQLSFSSPCWLLLILLFWTAVLNSFLFEKIEKRKE